MAEVRSDGRLEDKSLGELVAIATGSVSRLVKSEIELAKMELKADAKKAATGSTLFAAAGLMVGIAVIMASICLAYVFITIGIWNWAAFLIVAGIYVAIAGALVLFGLWRMKKISGPSRTRQTVKDDIAVLRRGRDDDRPALPE